MIFLIVNADDLGIHPQRDRGILEAHREGIVTSTTVIANGASFDSAAAQVRSAGLPTGIHLNLSDGVTLSGPISGLTDQENRLPGKVLLRSYLLAPRTDLAGIRREFCAQIEKILAAGLEPDHIDGHQHCQCYPPLTEMIVDLARRYGLDAMRSSLPVAPAETTVPEDLRDDLTLFQRIGRQAHGVIRGAGMRTPEGLWGLPLLHKLDTTHLCALLKALPEGHWELMTHPGYPWPGGSAFEGQQRLVELRALCSSEAKSIVEQRNIRLCTYKELPCAS